MSERGTRKLMIAQLYNKMPSEVIDPDKELGESVRDLIDISYMQQRHYNRIKDIIEGKQTKSGVPIDKAPAPDDNIIAGILQRRDKYEMRRAINAGWI
jgi:hypothetical protein